MKHNPLIGRQYRVKSAMWKTCLAVFVLCALVLGMGVTSVHAMFYVDGVTAPDEVLADPCSGYFVFRANCTVK